ncbi:MAG: hypothetical protein AAGA66_06090 [Bacteroidota bacterium]
MKKLLPLFYLIALAYGCQDEINSDDLQVRPYIDGIEVISDASVLSDRFHERNENVSVRGLQSGRVETAYQLTLVSEIDPPKIRNEQTMATSVDIADGLIAVSYNYIGEDFRGGVDLISRNGETLSLVSQLAYDRSDISMVFLSDQSIYYAGGSPDSDSVAFADAIALTNTTPDLSQLTRRSVGGHLATCVAKSSNQLFIT